jgi:hypothetical protein
LGNNVRLLEAVKAPEEREVPFELWAPIKSEPSVKEEPINMCVGVDRI